MSTRKKKNKKEKNEEETTGRKYNGQPIIGQHLTDIWSRRLIILWLSALVQ